MTVFYKAANEKRGILSQAREEIFFKEKEKSA